MKLTEAKVDMLGIIRRIGGDARLANRITAIGITEGTPFQVVKNDRNMPVLLYVRETLIALNRRDAEVVEVEVGA
ncbi:MAG: ferrous iron transport protein A [Lachnospiraceae bacterium]|nr:ferrous iron transport protein A [Lachnospiraceae bacterium]